MGRQKSLLKSIRITVAARQHFCKYDKTRKILKGEARLEIKEGRNISRYCLETAEVLVESAIKKLQGIASEIQETRTSEVESKKKILK